jgi:hypothetical protein
MRNPMLMGILGAIHAARGDQGSAGQILHQLDQLAMQKYVSPSVYAPIYAQLGDRDSALQHLEKGFEEGSPRLFVGEYRAVARPAAR